MNVIWVKICNNNLNFDQFGKSEFFLFDFRSICRSTFDVRHSTFDARRSSFVIRRSTFDVWLSTFDTRYSTFDNRRCTFDVWCSTFVVRCSTLTFNGGFSTFDVFEVYFSVEVWRSPFDIRDLTFDDDNDDVGDDDEWAEKKIFVVNLKKTTKPQKFWILSEKTKQSFTILFNFCPTTFTNISRICVINV